MQQQQDHDLWQGVSTDQVPGRSSAPRNFRWNLLWIPIACLFLAWMFSGVRSGFSWEDVMQTMNVRNEERFTRLAVLGVVLIAITAIWRLCRNDRDEN